MGRRRRAIAALVVLACLAGLAAVARGGDRSRARMPAPAPAPAAPVAPDAAAHVVADDAGRRRVAARRARAALHAELRALRRSRTVLGALRRAWLGGTIDRATHRELRHVWSTALRAQARLSGTRRAELGAVIAAAARLARDRGLTDSRLEAVFLTLRRNRDYWTRQVVPVPGQRFVFGRDPVTFQYYAGQGLQIQPLASFGHANALASSCLQPHPRFRCRPRALRRILDRMLALASERDGFLGWEYYFAFGGGAPPWISAMTQGTGAQALARGSRVLGDRRYAVAARRALGAFEQPPPAGVAVAVGGGRRYAMYSFDPGMRILNGELQAVIG
ncbi:MAG TPA: D-glucuronyl C5-epimerase family protein, partial [Solirubrobacteraceae bacterium]